MNSIVEKYGDSVVVLGFPCNQFGHQSNEGDTEFLNSLKYVRPGNGFVPSFHVFGKIQVNGANSHPLFRWMRQQIPIPMDPPGDSKGNGVDDWDVLVLPRSGFDSTTIAPWSPITRSDVAWNFEKFLIDSEGNLIRRYSRYYPTLNITEDIDELLKKECQT